jgi:nifR3 family TIM-barrel protein
MKNPALVGEIVKAVSSAANVPVTVKIRKGFGGVNNAPEIAKIAEQSGAAAVTVHGRTKEQLYSGQADWEIIKSVKEAVSIPVIGNGDIASPEHAKQMLDMTGCDAVMIGRAAEGNPWIFLQTNHFLETGELLPSPSAKEKIQLALEHFEMSIADKGEHIGMIEMRRHLCAYIKGMAGAVAAKNLINTADSPQKVTEILQSMI